MKSARREALRVLLGVGVGLLGFGAAQASEPIVVDHHAVRQFDQIPEYWLEQAKKITIHYGHTSDGSQIIAGANYLRDHVDPVKYNFSVRGRDEGVGLPPDSDPPALRMWEQGSWPYDYWSTPESRAATSETLATGLFDLTGWAWCGQVSVCANYLDCEGDQYIFEYLGAMNDFEQAFPDVMVFYMTGYAVEQGVVGNNDDRLLRNNRRIRDYSTAGGKVLFDFADIDRWDPDGNDHLLDNDRTCTWCYDWCAEHPEDCIDLPTNEASGGCGDNECDACAHTHGLSCVNKAKAFWWMMARLAGWPGVAGAPTAAPPPRFSLDAASPSVPGVSSSDVLAPGPVGGPPAQAVSAATLGLSTSGELDAMTAGALGDGLVELHFSVQRSSLGDAGEPPDVASEASVGQAAGDIYVSVLDGSNNLAPNQDILGQIPEILPYIPAGENVDNLDALDLAGASPILFSLRFGHEYEGTALGCGADLFAPGPALSISYLALGLLECEDDIDAVHLVRGSGDIYLSLTPGSPSLGPVPASPIAGCEAGCGPADVFLAPGGQGPLSVVASAADLGLLATDDIDAMALLPVRTVPEPGANLLGACALVVLAAWRKRAGRC